MRIFSKRKVETTVGILLLSTLFASAYNDIRHDSEKEGFCNEITTQLSEIMDKSELGEALSSVDAKGSITIRFSYAADKSEFQQTPIFGSHNCYGSAVSIDLSPNNEG